MGKIRSRIRSICRLQFADAADAASWDIAPGTGAVLPDDAALTEVKVERYASMRAETAPEGGSDVCETVITARTYCRLPGDMARKVWVATGVNGERWVVGGTVQPYATVETQEECPDDPAGDHATVLSVTWRDKCGPVRVF